MLIPTGSSNDNSPSKGANSGDNRYSQYDYFRGRLMVPIRNENGIIVPYAFDPALMNSALPVGYWMAQMNDTSGNKSIYYTSPDQYLPPSFVDHRSHQIVGESYRDNQTFFEYNNTLSRLSQIQNFQDARAARTQGPPQD